MKSLLKYPMALVFFLFILVTFLTDVLNEDRYKSEFENKILATMPSFSINSFMDGSFGQKYVSYINDQFVNRDQWISLKAVADKGLGRVEAHGVGFGDEDYLMEKLQIVPARLPSSGTNVVEERSLNRSVGMVRSFLEKQDRPITFTLIPNSYNVLSDKLPKGFPGADQEQYSQEIYTQLKEVSPQLEVVDFTQALKQHTDEYIYYRTDHHWTTLGAYYAYEEYCREKGLTPVELSSLEGHEVEDFYGTFYSKARRPGQQSDTITWYDVPVEEFAFTANLKQDKELETLGHLVQEDGLELLSVDGMMDERKFATRDKYGAFMWGNSGYVKIRSAHNLDHQEGETKRLLLFKDSYANSMIPFLTYNYDEIIVIDLRSNAKSVKELMKEDFEDVLLMYNFSTFISESSSLANLKF